MLAVRQLFALTPSEVQLLLAIIQRPMVTRPTGDKITDVRVHYIRKRLAPFGIAITTICGSGYQLSDPHRAMDLILARVAGQPVL
jgi:hypothetical protein